METREKYAQPEVVEFWTRFAEEGLQSAEAAMLERYGPSPPGRVLDIGCGAGRVALALTPKGYRVTGLDISEPMLEAARSLAAKRQIQSEFVLGDLVSLPFRSSDFDLALIFIAALQHVEGRAARRAAFGELARVLTPGGRLILALDNLAPALRCYASWAFDRVLRLGGGQVSSATARAVPSKADEMLRANRSRVSAVGWHARGVLRTLRLRSLETARDAARRLRLAPGELGDTFIEQVAMPKTAGKVYYHLYRHDELVEDARSAGFILRGYHATGELEGGQRFKEMARRLDKQVFYAFER